MQPARALSQWEAEGGALPGSQRMQQGESQVTRSDNEHDLLERLGAAVVSEWTGLPMRVRRSLFERAAHLPPEDGPLRARLARFLHDR
jgi:hypothetical protein